MSDIDHRVMPGGGLPCGHALERLGYACAECRDAELAALREQVQSLSRDLECRRLAVNVLTDRAETAESLVREAIDIIEGRPGDESPFAWPDKARAALSDEARAKIKEVKGA